MGSCVRDHVKGYLLTPLDFAIGNANSTLFSTCRIAARSALRGSQWERRARSGCRRTSTGISGGIGRSAKARAARVIGGGCRGPRWARGKAS